MKLNEKQLASLLSVASKKLGTTPEKLKSQLSNGTFEKAMGGMDQADAMRLRQALSNPKLAEKILSTPQAQEIYREISK